jgi:hypothetical protein
MTLVEGFEPDAVALARSVNEPADLDRDPGEHDEAFLDDRAPSDPGITRLPSSVSCSSKYLVDN